MGVGLRHFQRIARNAPNALRQRRRIQRKRARQIILGLGLWRALMTEIKWLGQSIAKKLPD
ncbi:MAG: hypothetical protein M3Q33_04850 [Acidobacteriota bacterium]|nr:hypothetical protein [Acidobacteriota bacterium]